MPDSVRDRILAAALELIGSHGVGGVTNRKIAATAGVSLGSVTYHFATQRDLLTEALLHFVHTEAARLAAVAERASADVSTVDEAAAVVARIAGAGPELAPFELYVHSGRDRAMRPAAADSFAAYDGLAATILRGMGMPETLAPAVVALVLGLQLRRLATGDPGTDVATAVTALVGGGRPSH